MSFAGFTELEAEIGRITSAADAAETPLRVFGGAAIQLHCPVHQYLYGQLKHSLNRESRSLLYLSPTQHIAESPLQLMPSCIA